MITKTFKFKSLEKKIGSLKCAVICISTFTCFMIVGTFLESFYGAEFASNAIYKTIPFMLIQFIMFLSILFAFYLRLPAKKRLYGFYTIHTGLILLAAGSFITWHAGIDGAILLMPKEPNRFVYLNQYEITVEYPNKNKKFSYDLPKAIFPKDLDITQGDIKFSTFLPSSDFVLHWKESKIKNNDLHSSEYFLSNDNVSQNFILSRHPEAKDFENSLQLGPLTIQYLPQSMSNCFNLQSKQRIFFWNSKNKTCFTPEKKNLKLQRLKSGKTFYVLPKEVSGTRTITFFPEISPFPMNEDLEIIKNSPLKIFNQKMFQTKPYLILFGKKAAYYLKDENKWVVDNIKKEGLDLPWMGFNIKALRHEINNYPVNIPEYTRPIQESGELIAGAIKAIKVSVLDETFWLNNQRPISLLVKGERIRLNLDKKRYSLPFELVLDRFKMNKDPGTNNPASYESFVKVFSNKGPGQHHIFMNNPLYYEGFTFYQASYSPREDGQYNSTLSVNVDQGRPIKYLGSLLLVFGAIWHYNLNKRKTVRKKST